MKQTLKKISFLSLFFFIATFILGCNDDYEEHNHEHNFKQYKIEKYTYKQASKLKSFKEPDKIIKNELNLKLRSLKKFNQIRTENATARDLNVDFAIDSSLIKQVTTDDITSYTMLVVLDSVDYSDGSFDNLVIQTNQNDETEAFVIHYQPSADVEYNAEHKSYNFEGTTTTSKVYGIYSFFNNGNNNTPGSNEGFESSEPGGSEGSVICVDVLKCNGTRTGGVGPIHNAGPGCTQTFTVRECSSNPNWNPYYTGSGGGESGGFSNGNNNVGPGGGGLSSGPDSENNDSQDNTTTTTVFPEEIGELNDDCTLFTNLQNKVAFKDIVAYFKTKTTDTIEYGYALTTTPTGYDALSSYNDPEVDYSVAFNQVDLAGKTINILIHTHYTGGLSIFSPDDLQQIYIMMKNTNITIPDNFTSIVVTPDNEVYALTIDSKENFIAFGDKNFSTEEKFYTFQHLFYLKNSNDGFSAFNGYNINVGNSKEVNEMNFLKMLEKSSGIKLYKANSDLSEWNNLKVNNINNSVTQTSPCN